MLKMGVCGALLMGAALTPFGADAKPARKGLIAIAQPDGSTLNIQLKGDEHAHRVFSEDGYLLTSDSEGNYTYATLNAAGEIVSSGRRAVKASARSAEDNAFLATLDKEAMTLLAQSIDTERVAVRKSARRNVMTRAQNSQGIDLLTGHYPSMGSPKALVVLVEYRDVKFTKADADYFHRLCNEKGFNEYGGTGSALDYFTENSGGLFTPEFDVYGPVSLPQRQSYYGGNDWSGNDQHPEEMAIDALDILDPDVDFSEYDTDGDGYIDNVFIFYAGYGEADGGSQNTVWPHSWEVYTGGGKRKVYDGVILKRYACSNEIDYTYQRPDGVGTFIHEFSHVMGLPDLYVTNYGAQPLTPGEWSCLDYGPYNNRGLTPPNYGLFERYSLGWFEPKNFGGTGTFDVVIDPVTEGDGYLVKTGNKNEFMLVEVRNRIGWDTYIPNDGMLVWRIDYDRQAWEDNTVNNSQYRQRVDILEADNIQSERTRGGDCFPGNKNITEFTQNTTPAFKTRAGESMNCEFTDIKLLPSGKVSMKVTCDLPEYDSVEEIGGEVAGWTLSGRTVANNGDKTLKIFTPSGMAVANVAPGTQTDLPAAGIYLIHNGVKASKVAVK